MHTQGIPLLKCWRFIAIRRAAMPPKITFADVVSSVRNVKDRDRKCALLIGAGCSVSADIPLAAGFVEEIQKKHKTAYDRAEQKTYAHCMAQLPPGDRRELIRPYMDSMRINWGHIAIAQLMTSGYVDRVLTTNFDSLLIRACALIDEFPATYDLASSEYFKPHQLPDKAIHYLHGLYPGFVQLHTEQQCLQHAKRLKPVFQEVGQGRVWIVVGYSGQDDPVFEELVAMGTFEHNLYWIGFENNEPAAHVHDSLLKHPAATFAHYLNGFDADGFFVKLAQELDCFPPDFVQRPFSCLERRIGNLAPFSLSGKEPDHDFLAKTRDMIAKAKQLEPGVGQPTQQENLATVANALMMAGKYDSVIALAGPAELSTDSELAELVAWAYITQGNQLGEEATAKKPKQEADGLFQQACQKFEAALETKSDMHDALNNWGNTLFAWAKTKTGPEADEPYAQACAKYEAALAIKPDKHETLYNWGATLADWAKTKAGAEADNLFRQACEKYEAALAIKPDMHDALNNWGAALSQWAKTKSGAEADDLFRLACEKYEAALAIKPDMHEALNNWGAALSDLAKTKSGAEADDLFRQACEKHKAALDIKPDMHEALYNWGNALGDLAKTKSGADADDLFRLACAKYEAALDFKPDKHEALNNWGTTLAHWAKTKTGPESDDLFRQACQKCEAALGIKPDNHEALNNWGAALANWAKTKTGSDADDFFRQACQKCEAALGIKPDMHEALNNWGGVLLYWAQTKTGDAADGCLGQAEDVLLRAEALAPGSGAYNLACLWARRGKSDECLKWLKVSQDNGTLPPKQHLIEDTDFEGVREEEWFKAFVAGLPEKE